MLHTSKRFSLVNILAVAVLIVLLVSVNASAQLATPDYSGSLWTRSTLTGDWGGARNTLAKKGITFNASVTQIYQGNFTDGSTGDEYWRNSGTADYEMDLDFGKLGLWPGGFLKVRGMSGYRKSLNPVAGALMPVNSDALFPWPNGNYTGLTDFLFAQFLSEHFGLLAGKMNTLSGDANEFAHDYKTQFLNTAFLINPVTFRTCPYSSVGTGAILLNKVATFNFLVMDTEGSAIKSGNKTVMHNGTTVAAELRFKTCILNLPGHQDFGGTWSNKKFNDLDQDPRTSLSQILVPGRGIPLKTYKDSWCFFYNMDHYLYLKEGTKDQGFGVFARYGVSDGKANPIKYFASFGIGGKGLIPGRCQDTFGVGYYHAWLSNQIPSIAYKTLLNGNEQGGELYYNIYLTPWVQLTPDLQIIESADKRVDNTVIVGGLRMQLNF
jgi:porin